MLAAVEGEHGLVGREPGKGGADDRRRDARGLRIALHLGEKAFVAAAALRGEGGGGEECGESESCEDAFCHGRSFTLS